MITQRNSQTALVQVEEVNILRVVKSEFKEANSIDEMIDWCFGKSFEKISEYIDYQVQRGVVTEIGSFQMLKYLLLKLGDKAINKIQAESDAVVFDQEERLQDYDGGKEIYVTTHEIIDFEDEVRCGYPEINE